MATQPHSDPNNLSSTKIQILLLARTPGDSHFQPHLFCEKTGVLFMAIPSRACASLVFYICLILAPRLRKFFFFLNPAPSLFSNNPDLTSASDKSQDPFRSCWNSLNFFLLSVFQHCELFWLTRPKGFGIAKFPECSPGAPQLNPLPQSVLL